MQHNQEPIHTEQQTSEQTRLVIDQKNGLKNNSRSLQSISPDGDVPVDKNASQAKKEESQMQYTHVTSTLPDTTSTGDTKNDAMLRQMQYLTQTVQQIQEELKSLRKTVEEQQEDERKYMPEIFRQEMREGFQEIKAYQIKQSSFDASLQYLESLPSLTSDMARLNQNMSTLYELEMSFFPSLTSFHQNIQASLEEERKYIDASIGNIAILINNILKRISFVEQSANRFNVEEIMNGIAAIHSKLQAIEQIPQITDRILKQQEAFSVTLEHMLTNVHLITVLHEEIQKYNDDVQFIILKPALLYLITIYEEMDRAIEATATNNEGRRSKRDLKAYEELQEDIELALSRLEVELFETEGNNYRSDRQKAIGSVTTSEQAKNNLIAKRVRPGFRYKNYILQHELVKIYKYA